MLDKLKKILRMRCNIAGQAENAAGAQHGFADAKNQIEKQLGVISRRVDECLWGMVFNSTAMGSTWLSGISFSPGRWAVGYSYLYVTYRILEEMHPRRILDIGMGQSTHMFARYVATHDDVELVVVESDASWMEFFGSTLPSTPRIRVVKLDYAFEDHGPATGVRVFAGFEQALRGDVFDLISVDAPFGGDMTYYSRVDVLKLIPSGLSKRFAIIFDDTERGPEINTVCEIRKRLADTGIQTAYGEYGGVSTCSVICSKDNAYFTSM